MEEAEHLLEVLIGAKEALKAEDSLKLKELSNQTIHTASIKQDRASIIAAVLIYSLSKIIEKKEILNIAQWKSFVKDIVSNLDDAIKAVEADDEEKYGNALAKARKALESVSSEVKPFIQEVLKKASINKASRIYEHGISLEQTAKLLGISQWELSSYVAQSKVIEGQHDTTLNVKQRAKMALEFFK